MSEPKQPPSNPFFVLEILFLVMCGMSAVLWLRGPATNTGQLIFRVAVGVVGVVGTIAVQIIKFVRNKNR